MNKFNWINEDTRTFLSRGYILEGETAESRLYDIAKRAEQLNGIEGFADKFYDYLGRNFFSLSSPVWANYGRKRGLPISCNGSFMADEMESIMYTNAEIGMMTKHGAGTSAYLGAIRPSGNTISSGGYADGPAHFAELLETSIKVVSQGNVRRGNCAVYLDIDHPDIHDFLNFREHENAVQKLSTAVCVSDEWMNSMLSGDTDKQDVWMRVIQKRFEEGMPYIFFSDNVNKELPQWYKDEGMKVHASNLCTEIALPSNSRESFVCCLMSMNLVTADEWMKTDAVETAIYFLDTVMEEYIQKIKGLKFMENAYNFSVNHRALGLGVLGYHSALQAKGIAFESMEAKFQNSTWHMHIRKKADEATRQLAKLFGPCAYSDEVRNTTVMAIAPTASSSFIHGQVSPGIEPYTANAFTADLQKGVFSFRNPYLAKVLEVFDRNDEETWRSIIINDGSVQHLNFLNDREKAVFRTASEISQLEIIQQAASRQKFIDQAQSINLWIHPDTPLKDYHELLVTAWVAGIKSLYYHHSLNPAQQLVRNLNNCVACQA